MPSKKEESWIFAVESKQIPENTLTVVYPKGVGILLIKQDDQLYALSNTCPHMACPLAKGTLNKYTLTCPCHEWRFDIRTGEFQDAPEIKINTYQWKESEGKIFIKM